MSPANKSVHVQAMTDDAPRPLTNNAADLPISATEKRDRFEAEGDALGALGWRCAQVRDLLNALANAVDDRNPLIQKLEQPPTWGDVCKITQTMKSLCKLARYLGVIETDQEVEDRFALFYKDADR